MATLILNISLNAWNVPPKIRDEWRSLGVCAYKLAQAAFASLAWSHFARARELQRRR